MEETMQQRMYRLLQFCVYLSVLLEVLLFVLIKLEPVYQKLRGYHLEGFVAKLLRLPFYRALLYSKLFTLLLACMVCVGTLEFFSR